MRLRRDGGARAAQAELGVELWVALLGCVNDDAPRLHPAVQLGNLVGTEAI